MFNKGRVMNIGVDLDGVVYQTESLFREYSEKYNKLIEGTLKDDSELKAFDRYNWTREQTNDFIQNTFYEIEKTAPLYPKVKEVLGELKKKNSIIFITSRGLVSDVEISLTMERLQEDNINFDKIVFSQNSKVKACLENKIDIMIDDYYRVIDELSSNGINCLYFRDKRNKPCESGAVEVYNWEEVSDFFKILNNK